MGILPSGGSIDKHEKSPLPHRQQSFGAGEAHRDSERHRIPARRLFPDWDETPLSTFIEEAAFSLPFIYVSAGKRGMQVRLDPSDLLRSVDGKRADFT